MNGKSIAGGAGQWEKQDTQTSAVRGMRLYNSRSQFPASQFPPAVKHPRANPRRIPVARDGYRCAINGRNRARRAYRSLQVPSVSSGRESKRERQSGRNIPVRSRKRRPEDGEQGVEDKDSSCLLHNERGWETREFSERNSTPPFFSPSSLPRLISC